MPSAGSPLCRRASPTLQIGADRRSESCDRRKSSPKPNWCTTGAPALRSEGRRALQPVQRRGGITRLLMTCVLLPWRVVEGASISSGSSLYVGSLPAACDCDADCARSYSKGCCDDAPNTSNSPMSQGVLTSQVLRTSSPTRTGVDRAPARVAADSVPTLFRPTAAGAHLRTVCSHLLFTPVSSHLRVHTFS